eukprot:Skav202616  [mRNA]  locus=scaffold3002:184636:187087:+ [translate_table: standard]
MARGNLGDGGRQQPQMAQQPQMQPPQQMQQRPPPQMPQQPPPHMQQPPAQMQQPPAQMQQAQPGVASQSSVAADPWAAWVGTSGTTVVADTLHKIAIPSSGSISTCPGLGGALFGVTDDA